VALRGDNDAAAGITFADRGVSDVVAATTFADTESVAVLPWDTGVVDEGGDGDAADRDGDGDGDGVARAAADATAGRQTTRVSL